MCERDVNVQCVCVRAPPPEALNLEVGVASGERCRGCAAAKAVAGIVGGINTSGDEGVLQFRNKDGSRERAVDVVVVEKWSGGISGSRAEHSSHGSNGASGGIWNSGNGNSNTGTEGISL